MDFFGKSKSKEVQVRKKLEIPPPKEVEARIRESIVGQDEAVKKLASLYVKLLSGVRSTRAGVIDSVFLAGPSGVGKTEAVITLAKMLMETAPEDNLESPEVEKIEKQVGKLTQRESESEADFTKRKAEFRRVKVEEWVGNMRANNPDLVSEKDVLAKVIKIDGGSFQHGHEIASLIGSPHGYLGFGSTVGLLHPNELLKREIHFTDFRGDPRKIIIILLDEAEKGHESLHNFFLTILDKGRFTLGDNTIADFSNAVIFFTSNIGNTEVEKSREHALGFQTGKVTPGSTFSKAFKGVFRPEYRGRINKTIIFEQLTPEALRLIANKQLVQIERQFVSSGVGLNLQFTSAAREFFIKKGYNLSEGARNLKKVMEQMILDRLILAMRGFDLNGKTIIVDEQEGGGEGVDFYEVSNAEFAASGENK